MELIFWGFHVSGLKIELHLHLHPLTSPSLLLHLYKKIELHQINTTTTQIPNTHTPHHIPDNPHAIYFTIYGS
jgi:hypothetical protein